MRFDNGVFELAAGRSLSLIHIFHNWFEEKGFSSLELIFNSAAPVGDRCVCGTRGWFYDAESDQDKKVLNREVGRLTASIEAGLKTGLEPVVFLHYPPVYHCLLYTSRCV